MRFSLIAGLLLSVSGVQFATIEDGTLWVIVGTVPSRDLNNWLPVIEEIMRKFEVGGMNGLDTSA